MSALAACALVAIGAVTGAVLAAVGARAGRRPSPGRTPAARTNPPRPAAASDPETWLRFGPWR